MTEQKKQEMSKGPGIGIEAPKSSCNDKNCPFHGQIKIRGKTFEGNVISAKAQKTVTVEIPRKRYIPKYERFEKRRTRIKAHNPECINAIEGNRVMIMETRPISKTKNFVVVKKEDISEKIRGVDLTAKPEEKKDKKKKAEDDDHKKPKKKESE